MSLTCLALFCNLLWKKKKGKPNLHLLQNENYKFYFVSTQIQSTEIATILSSNFLKPDQTTLEISALIFVKTLPFVTDSMSSRHKKCLSFLA